MPNNARSLAEGARAIVFDLDGTLVDTIEDLWLALNDALAEHGLPSVPRAAILADIHYGLDKTARATLGRQNTPPQLVEEVITAYRKHYRKRAHRASRLYDGVREFIACCQARGQTLAVCTNKLATDACELLDLLGIADSFSVLTGIEDCGAAKPDPAPLWYTLERMGFRRDDAVFIGDSEIDAACARNAGVPFLLHENGFGPEAALAVGCAGRFSYYRELYDTATLAKEALNKS